MPGPTLLTAGDTTTHRLGQAEINTGSVGSPTWLPIQYIEDYDLQTDNAVMNDATVFADGGFTGQDKTGTAWQLNLVLNHMSVPGSTPPAYDASHLWLESHGVGQLGAANRVQLRMYDWDVNDASGVITPRGQAYSGFANYSWPGYGAGKSTDPRMVNLSFLGKGKLNPISHPFPLVATVPTVASVSPSALGTAGGTAVRILGSGFTGTTGVTFAGTAATGVSVISDNEIVAVAPAHTAGSGAVVVTNATGPSVSNPTVTYA